jgi:signal transduction histidine kinase
VVKHSGSKVAVVRLTGGPDAICLTVSDSGKGFNVEASKEGIGLVGMRERVLYVGGELSIRSRPSGGTLVEVRIPLKATSSQVASISREST